MTAQPHAVRISNDGLLHGTLIANAATSGILGVAMLAGAGPFSRLLGIDSALAVGAVGVGLIGWVALIVSILRQERLSPGRVNMIIAGDVAWVIASWAILLSGRPELSTEGWWAVVAAAEGVTVFAVLQYLGLRRLTGR